MYRLIDELLYYPASSGWLPPGPQGCRKRLMTTKDDLLDSYADVDEVSRRLNIHPESVRRLIRQGKLPAIKFGNKWLVEAAILEQFSSRYDPRPGNKATLL